MVGALAQPPLAAMPSVGAGGPCPSLQRARVRRAAPCRLALSRRRRPLSTAAACTCAPCGPLAALPSVGAGGPSLPLRHARTCGGPRLRSCAPLLAWPVELGDASVCVFRAGAPSRGVGRQEARARLSAPCFCVRVRGGLLSGLGPVGVVPPGYSRCRSRVCVYACLLPV